MAPTPKKICYFCGKKVDDGSFCYGCGHFVCIECDETGPLGAHKVEDHKEGG